MVMPGIAWGSGLMLRAMLVINARDRRKILHFVPGIIVLDTVKDMPAYISFSVTKY
jgi:hypothetical protein